VSGDFSELKPGFPQIVFSRIRRRVHDKNHEENKCFKTEYMYIYLFLL